jgi:transcriptional/translational regulatory protein YebC/TACO1
MLAAIDGGAEDIAKEGDVWRVTTDPHDLHTVRTAIEEGGFTVESGDLAMVAQNHIAIEDVSSAKKVLDLIDHLEDLDDVQDVFGNFDISDEILAQLE